MSWAILIVEDDPTLRDILVTTLEDYDQYLVYGASSPSEALALARENIFDLVVTDVRMDEMDGIQCLQQMRFIQPDLRSIVITGYASDDAPGRAIRVEAEDYLFKPFGIAQFLTAVERVLEVEKEKSLYEQVVGAVNHSLKALARLAGTAISQAELASLERLRDRAFQSLYVAIRSGMLVQGDGLGMWDRLEQLETDREQLKTPGFHGKERQALADGYRHVVELMAALSRAGLRAQPASRKPHQVAVPDFNRFFRRIKAGELSVEQVKLAPFLRQLSTEARTASPELEQLYEKAWGADVKTPVS
ncbi:MAG: hypothetical protein AMXMBFR33_11680 [Candidatus Xenobia bacterium]